MSANRAGKREREAGRRHKRGIHYFTVPTPSGPECERVKLGHKKSVSRLRAFMGHTGGRYSKAAGDGTYEIATYPAPHGKALPAQGSFNKFMDELFMRGKNDE